MNGIFVPLFVMVPEASTSCSSKLHHCALTMRTMAEYTLERPYYYWWYSPSFPGNVLSVVFNILQFLLALRLVLVFLGANASAPLVAWFYDFTGRLIGPFSGAFPDISLGIFVIELSTIFAMIGYAIIAWIIFRILSLIPYSM